MQTPAPEAPLAPGSPEPAAIAGGAGQASAAPKLGIEQLITQRQELSSQLTRVTRRRAEVARELGTTTDVAARTGLQERLQVLDKQIMQLETDLAATSRAIANSPGQLLGSSEAPGFRQPDHFDDGLVVGGMSVGVPLLVLMLVLRRRWRRRAQPASIVAPASDARIERIESSVEAIAIEIERVSEGQRFVTKLLSESPSHFRPSLTAADRETNRQPVEVVATSLPKRES